MSAAGPFRRLNRTILDSAARGLNSASPSLRGDFAKLTVTALLSAPIRFYKAWISPLLGPGNCRYHPTCSTYALQALKIHGPVKGAYLAVRRILSCHAYSRRPFHDPVPPKTKS